ncbi:unnamed protein product [Umbelopsis vinacea]
MSLVDFISEKLATVDLKDSEISEYIAGIVSEEYLEESEKREALAEFLSESTDKPTDDLIDSFFVQWNEDQEKEKKAAEAAKAETVAKAKEREKKSLAVGIENVPSSGGTEKEPLTMSRRMAPKQMTKEERAQRERLMREYGYDLEDVVEGANGETEIVFKDRSKKSADDTLLMGNNNAARIKEEEQRRREKMKQESEKEKERIKQQQEKQKLDREKEKRRTMKKEKRRM